MKRPNKSFLKSVLFISALCVSASAYADVEKTLQYTSELNQGDQVYFTGDNASVNIVKGDSDTVVYDVKMIYKKDNKQKAEETFNRVEWTFSEGSKTQLEEKIRKYKKVKNLKILVTITVPDNHPLHIESVNGYIKTKDDFQTDVTVRSVNGEIKWEGNIGGALYAHNVNGVIQTGNVAKNCKAKVVNGSIRLGAIGGDLETHNVNGETNVGEVGAVIDSSSVNGSIYLTLTKEATGAVKMKTVNGSLKVTCPESLGITISARSKNNALFCEKSLNISKMKKGKLEGTSGDGSVNMQLKSINGSVTIKAY